MSNLWRATISQGTKKHGILRLSNQMTGGILFIYIGTVYVLILTHRETLSIYIYLNIFVTQFPDLL